MHKTVVLLGNNNICKQIAYVLDIKKYKIIENLQELEQYKKYKIIICDKNIKIKSNKNIINLKKVYKKIDKGHYKRYNFTKHNLKNILYIIRPKTRNIKLINKIPSEYLRPSEMLIKTLNSKTLDIECDNLEKTCYIDFNGNMWGCCPGWIEITFGNIKNEIKNNNYNSYLSRIIKLSSINKTYCFCDFNKCKYNHASEKQHKLNMTNLKNYPEKLTIATDKSCNLKCPSCRKCYYKANKKQQKKLSDITDSIIKTKWLEKTTIILAGQGEVFYSNSYKQLLVTNKKRKTIEILTNGTLFNKKNWSMLENKYENIHVFVSIDAATKETYQKLRCGNFEFLLKNLEMLGNLRIQNKIKKLQFNYVVQKDNYQEMKQFVNIAKQFNVDNIQFTKLNNWGTYKRKEYIEKSLIIDNKYLDYKFYKLLKDPIFNDKIIDLTSFQILIKNSDDFYGNNE